MRVQDKRPQETSASDFGLGWVIVYGEPSHFFGMHGANWSDLDQVEAS
jgi:hypothetical protein